MRGHPTCLPFRARRPLVPTPHPRYPRSLLGDLSAAVRLICCRHPLPSGTRGDFVGLRGRTRTCDIPAPNRELCQTELHADGRRGGSRTRVGQLMRLAGTLVLPALADSVGVEPTFSALEPEVLPLDDESVIPDDSRRPVQGTATVLRLSPFLVSPDSRTQDGQCALPRKARVTGPQAVYHSIRCGEWHSGVNLVKYDRLRGKCQGLTVKSQFW